MKREEDAIKKLARCLASKNGPVSQREQTREWPVSFPSLLICLVFQNYFWNAFAMTNNSFNLKRPMEQL